VPDSDLPQEEFQDAFARIEAAVDSGNADLSSLGFWRLIREIKADPRLTAHWAEAAGRIDRKAFELRVRPRFRVWLGNAVLLAGTLVGAGAAGYAVACDNRTVSGALLVGAGLMLSGTVHDLAHWAWGRAVGIRFIHYFFGGVMRLEPGLKTDYASYLRAPPVSRAMMHASGAIASKIAPVIPLALWPAANAPACAAWSLAGYTALLLVADATYSTKKSDWKRVRRELLVARAQESRRG